MFIFGDCGGRQKESDAAVFIMGREPVEFEGTTSNDIHVSGSIIIINQGKTFIFMLIYLLL